MAESSQKWHNGTSSKTRSTETSDGLAAIQAQLNNLGREIKKVNEKVYAAQVGCELSKGPHYTKDCPLKEEVNTLKEAYYTQFGAPYQPVGQYRATGPGLRMKILSIRNQGASIKTLEIQIGQMSKVLQERGIRGLPGSTKPNPRDHVKSISTTKANSSKIRRMGYSPYTVSGSQRRSFIIIDDEDVTRDVVLGPCYKEIDDMVYSVKRDCVELVRRIPEASSTHICSRTQLKNHPRQQSGSSSFYSISHFL
ncbi:hypothetical protein Tco_0800449 [Tanacetum coccineum]|uniref:Uncharacterized protein n=1 Tax=Tanacetum coccineum TaxID=301880 RepID=A0ABQ4ZVV1_9ASTR